VRRAWASALPASAKSAATRRMSWPSGSERSKLWSQTMKRDKLRLNAEMAVRFAIALEVTTDELLGCTQPTATERSRQRATSGKPAAGSCAASRKDRRSTHQSASRPPEDHRHFHQSCREVNRPRTSNSTYRAALKTPRAPITAFRYSASSTQYHLPSIFSLTRFSALARPLTLLSETVPLTGRIK
jgi:hypothetical protein